MTKITEAAAAAIAGAYAKPRAGTTARIRYENWRGETDVRTLNILAYWYGATEWHPQGGEMFTAFEPSTGKTRDFAVSGVKDWNVA